jgi:hypothetical protein
MGDLEGLELLLAERAIRRVIGLYARGVDRVDLELVRSCYWPEAVDSHGPFVGVRDDYIEWLRTLLARHTMTMHKLGPPLIEWDGAVAAVETYGVAWHSGEPAGDDRWNNVAGLRYVDRFECRSGEWRIASRTTVAEWVSPWQRDDELSGRFGNLARRNRTDQAYLVGE